jgi:hypothetical protein
MRKLITYIILFFSFFLYSQEPLFTLVDNSETGIDFSNDLVDTRAQYIFVCKLLWWSWCWYWRF